MRSIVSQHSKHHCNVNLIDFLVYAKEALNAARINPRLPVSQLAHVAKRILPGNNALRSQLIRKYDMSTRAIYKHITYLLKPVSPP